jgi:hypothetical protein
MSRGAYILNACELPELLNFWNFSLARVAKPACRQAGWKTHYFEVVASERMCWFELDIKSSYKY